MTKISIKANKKVLIGDYHPWESTIRIGSHHYAKLFLQGGWQVGYIGHPISPVHVINTNNKPRFANWVSGGMASDNLFSYVPLTVLPYLNFPGLRSEYASNKTLKLCIPSLKRILNKEGLGEVKALFVSDPVLAGLAEIVSYDRFVLRVADRMGAFHSSPSSMGQLVERSVLKADVVFATSEHLCEELKCLRPDVMYLPNGCDYEHFAALSHQEPLEYMNIPRPRIVYAGAISDWFDCGLISSVASTHPEISFILIGPISCSLRDLPSLKNVYILGPRPYSQLPVYMQHADVGMIPFVKSSLTDAVSPIKLFEYCATGLPVVATDLAETRLYANHEFVLTAATREEFANLLLAAIEQKEKTKDKCRAFAYKNSWEERFSTIMKHLEGTR